jgi:hypothetical protein
MQQPLFQEIGDAHSGFQRLGTKEQGEENHKQRGTGNEGGMGLLSACTSPQRCRDHLPEIQGHGIRPWDGGRQELARG